MFKKSLFQRNNFAVDRLFSELENENTCDASVCTFANRQGWWLFFKMAVACLHMLKTFSVCVFHVGSFAFARIAQKLKKTNDSIEKMKQTLTFLPNFIASSATCLARHASDSCFLLLLAMMQAHSFMEKWHKSTTNRKNECGSSVNFFNRRIFFWICLETIKTMEGHFNLLDTFLTLDGKIIKSWQLKLNLISMIVHNNCLRLVWSLRNWLNSCWFFWKLVNKWHHH